MKVIFNLKELKIIDSGKTTIDRYGNELSNITIHTILSFITRKYMYSKYQTVKIHSSSLKNISNDYKMYLQHFYNTGVLLWTNYKEGVESRGYYFTDHFKNKAEISKIEVEKEDYEDNRTPFNPDIDKEVDTKLRRDFKSLKVENNPINKEIEIETNDLFVYNFKGYISSIINMEMMKQGKLYFNWKSGRLYTNFCNCGNNIRLNNFSFGGEKLYTYDIPSSFPLWLSIWSINNGIDKNDYDFISYCSDVAEKDKHGRTMIYEKFRQQLNKIKDLDSKADDLNSKAKAYYSRAEAKDGFMKWINGKEKDDILNNMFKIYYPAIYNVVDRSRYKMYDELVKLETNWIMNTVVKKLYTIRGIKIITCHDQIYFQEKYLNEVKNIWIDELNNIYKLTPINTSNFSNNDDNIESTNNDIFKSKFEDVEI